MIWYVLLLVSVVYWSWRLVSSRKAAALFREADHSGPGRMNAHVFAWIRNDPSALALSQGRDRKPQPPTRFTVGGPGEDHERSAP